MGYHSGLLSVRLMLVSPILPGRTEACGRLVQETNDGRGDATTGSSQ
jgi:hypothetical protein